jgi:hypothetical protein
MSKRFPRTESEIAALGLRVVEGLVNKAEDFPNPPLSAAELKEKLDVFNAADTAARRQGRRAGGSGRQPEGGSQVR